MNLYRLLFFLRACWGP